MTPTTFNNLILSRSMSDVRSIAGGFPDAANIANRSTGETQCLQLAIAGQESAWTHRIQLPNGPARSFWQCEERGAVIEALTNARTAPFVKAICSALELSPGLSDVYEAIAYNDTLAWGIARATLFLDPAPIPMIGDEETSWQYYIRNWRPGKPDRSRWSIVYPQCTAIWAPRTTP